jgi:ankyrin repeat protein
MHGTEKRRENYARKYKCWSGHSNNAAHCMSGILQLMGSKPSSPLPTTTTTITTPPPPPVIKQSASTALATRSHTQLDCELREAAAAGDGKRVIALLDASADVNARSVIYNKDAPLHIASTKGHNDVVLVLLDRQANVNQCNSNRCTPLLKACESNTIQVVQTLLHHNADVNARCFYNSTALHRACRFNFRAIGLLLHRQADINARNNNKHTPLHMACKSNHHDAIMQLIEYGADIYSTYVCE